MQLPTMLSRDKIVVCCENHMEQINTLHRQNAELLSITVSGA
jgi:hypothetical protein